MQPTNSTASLSSIFGGNTNFKRLNQNPINLINPDYINNITDSFNDDLLISSERHSSSQVSLHSEYNHSSLSLATTLSILNSELTGGRDRDVEMFNKLHPAEILQSKLETKYVPENINTMIQNIQPLPIPLRKVPGKLDTYTRFLDKYNITGKTIGEGASGKVSIISLKADSTKLYAMKVFHSDRVVPNSYDTHLKKIILEYSIGSILKQQNIIKTLDLLIDNPNKTSIIILEYVPYDFFNLVMANQMNKYESACFFKQLCHAIQYMHSMGIAHRDLKLDNCVVTSQGILKLLDLGSAVIFKSEENGELQKCVGIVGSDPYLSPELLRPSYRTYDPRPVDVWALAIMYYCMILSKFPWKAPRKSFNSFRLFCEDPEDEDDVSKGPLRLLRALPSESHGVISQMMDLNPVKRISVDHVLQDKWMKSIPECHYNSQGILINDCEDHTHHLITEEELQRQLEDQELQRQQQNNNIPQQQFNIPSFQHESELNRNHSRHKSGRKLSL
ncbi:probable serine/threonine-protein kinase Rtk1p [Monosporozyma unispora]